MRYPSGSLDQCSTTPWSLSFIIEHLPQLKCLGLNGCDSDWLVKECIKAAFTESDRVKETWLEESVEDVPCFKDIDDEEQGTLIRSLKHYMKYTLEARNLRIINCSSFSQLFPHLNPQNEATSTVLITA